MATTYIVDKDGNQIDASAATVPSDRHFRGAWSLSGSVISEDMDAAKAIFKDKIREVRGPLLEAEDGIRDFCLSRGLGDVYKRQSSASSSGARTSRILSLKISLAFVMSSEMTVPLNDHAPRK